MGEYVNSTQIRIEKSAISCGVMQAHHIPADVKQAVFALCNSMYHKANGRPCAFIIWSDVVRSQESRGKLLRQAIEEIPDFGAITASIREVNPKTGNPIQMWIWAPNHEACRKWYQDEYMNALREETD